MGQTGPRFFVPPWTDPIEPNVDPLLVAGINALGTAMAWEMYGQGKTGIVVNAIFDAWTPARAYQHYHGGVRILTETASARLATPIHLPFDSLQSADAQLSSWNFPDPWPGGDWRLADIVDYMEAGALALLKQAALYRERWLGNFYQIGLRAIGGRAGWPRAFVIPAAGQNADGLADLLRILVTGAVEVRRAEAAFVLDGRRYEAGTYVVPLAQPYSAFAKTLLEAQRYPSGAGGIPRRPAPGALRRHRSHAPALDGRRGRGGPGAAGRRAFDADRAADPRETGAWAERRRADSACRHLRALGSDDGRRLDALGLR